MCSLLKVYTDLRGFQSLGTTISKAKIKEQPAQNVELGSEFDGETLKSNQKWCHMRSFGGPALEFSSSVLMIQR